MFENKLAEGLSQLHGHKIVDSKQRASITPVDAPKCTPRGCFGNIWKYLQLYKNTDKAQFCMAFVLFFNAMFWASINQSHCQLLCKLTWVAYVWNGLIQEHCSAKPTCRCITQCTVCVQWALVPHSCTLRHICWNSEKGLRVWEKEEITHNLYFSVHVPSSESCGSLLCTFHIPVRGHH